jgi:hypothetical protein
MASLHKAVADRTLGGPGGLAVHRSVAASIASTIPWCAPSISELGMLADSLQSVSKSCCPLSSGMSVSAILNGAASTTYRTPANARSSHVRSVVQHAFCPRWCLSTEGTLVRRPSFRQVRFRRARPFRRIGAIPNQALGWHPVPGHARKSCQTVASRPVFA